MTDRPENEPHTGPGEDATALIRSARIQLTPLLGAVLDALAADVQAQGSAASQAPPMSSGDFFAAAEFLNDLLARLQSVETESELLHLFLDISLLGFQGFEFSTSASAAADRLLQTCETIALTMTAGGSNAH